MCSDGGGESPSDAFLVASLTAGDAAALRTLVDRYDRLVRYTIYRLTKDRCVKDPQWLDAVASTTWTGFVRAMRRPDKEPPRSVSALLASIARNQAVSALRGRPAPAISLEGHDAEFQDAESIDPADLLVEVEELDTLRACLACLDADDRLLVSQLRLITERRWRAAAEALGMSESTLRSKWGRVLDRLRACVERKTASGLARRPGSGDS